MTETFGPFEGVTLEEIYTSYINGQKHQMAVMINYYGPEFWKDFAGYVLELSNDEERWFKIYTLVVVSYHTWFPHPNQQDMKGLGIE